MPTVIVSSARDRLLPSIQEGARLLRLIPGSVSQGGENRGSGDPPTEVNSRLVGRQTVAMRCPFSLILMGEPSSSHAPHPSSPCPPHPHTIPHYL